MPEPAIGLRLEVALEPDADAAELEHATSQLREELLELDLERVDRPTEPAPPGSRGLDIAALGTLIVGAGRGAIGPVLTAVQSWVARRSSRSVRITIDGDSLELTNASREDQRRLVESFLARHSP
jgi:Effector Associated Constant Component 1